MAEEPVKVSGEQKTLKQSFIEFYVVLVMLSIFTGVSVPGYYGARWSAQKKACASNMRSIQGAYELAVLDKVTTIGNLSSLTKKELQNQGYLKTLFPCPGSVTGDWDYKVFSQGGQGSETIDVSCPVHGTLSLQETDDRTKGIQNSPLLGRIWIQVARIILLSLFVAVPFLLKELVLNGAKMVIQFILKR